MTIIFWFIFYLVSDPVCCDGEMEVSGYSGGSVIINCPYNLMNYISNTKYFCKMHGSHEEQCFNLSQTDGKHGRDGRFYFSDDTVAGVYSILFRNLSQQDEGKYRCAAGGGAKLSDVDIEVKEDVCNETSLSKTANLGENVTFTCTLPCRDADKEIYGYKVANNRIHALLCTSETSSAGPSEHSVRNCRLSISNVTGDDEGLYLCGVERDKEDKRGVPPYVIIFSEMHLQVTDPVPRSAGASGSSTIITVCVIVVLLLIAGFTLVISTLKHKRAQGANSSTNKGNTVNTDEVLTYACYNDVPDEQDTSTTIYATTQKHKAPEDIYSVVQLPKAGCATMDSYPL